METCQRCGQCCLTVGRTFWKHGNLDAEKPFSNNALLNLWANNDDHSEDGGPCEMLIWLNGVPTCFIHAYYGEPLKPSACKQYPEPGTRCAYEQAREQGREHGKLPRL